MPTFYGPPSDGTVIPEQLENALAADIAAPESPIGAAVRGAVGTSADVYEVFDGFQMVSGPDVTASGDSLTAGAGGGGTSWPSAMQDILNSVYSDPGTVTNLGVGGETPETIAGRAVLGTPWLATVDGGQIPATGGVTVTLASSNGAPVAPLVQGTVGINPVQIAGVTGSLSLSGGAYTFTRSTDGVAVSVPNPTPVTTKAQRERQSDIVVMWWGQNGDQDADNIISLHRAAIRRLRAFRKRWLVLGLTTGTGASREVMDNKFQNEYGEQFLNVREYLSRVAALNAEGITPTQGDLDAIAVGSVPPSFLSDGTHMNAAGYRRIGRAVYERLRTLGWNDQWGAKGDDPGEEIGTYWSDGFERSSGDIVGSTTDTGELSWLRIGAGSAPIVDGAATTNSTGDLLVYVTSGQSDGVLTFGAKSVGTGGTGSGILFRFANIDNYWFIRPNTGVWQLLKRVAGTMSVVDTDLGPAADGDIVAITLNADAITITVNGVEQYMGVSADHQTANGFGLRGGTSGAVAVEFIEQAPLA